MSQKVSWGGSSFSSLGGGAKSSGLEGMGGIPKKNSWPPSAANFFDLGSTNSKIYTIKKIRPIFAVHNLRRKGEMKK